MSNQAVLASMAPGDDAAASWHAGAPRSAVRSGGVGLLAREGTDDSLDEEALDGVEEDLDDELDDELDEDEDDEDDDELDEFEDDELDDEDDDDDADEIDLTTDRHDRSCAVADEGG